MTGSHQSEVTLRLIVEGPDGAGKTRMVDRLLNRYPKLDLVDRACTSENGPIGDLVGWVNHDLTSRSRGFYLYDRHPMISELIYSPALGRPMNEGFQNPHWLHQALSEFESRGYYIILCLPPYEVMKENILATHTGDHDHTAGVLASMRSIWNLYYIETARRARDPRTWVWDYTRMIFQGGPMVRNFDSMLEVRVEDPSPTGS